MTQTILKKYQLKLLTLGPVHISNGQTYNTKDYLLSHQYYHFPDPLKVYQQLSKRGFQYLKAYEEFLLPKSSKNKHRRLNQFLDRFNIKEEYLGGYKIPRTGFETKKDNQKGTINEVSQFIKNAYGDIYIPGSSIKGALRTILINEKFQNMDNTDEVKDIFSKIKVTDSKPISKDNLIITAKLDWNPKKNDFSAPNIFREAIRPNVLIETEITVEDSSSDADLIKIMDNFGQVTIKYYQRYYKNVLKGRFPKKYVTLGHINKGIPILYLGAGAGLWSKVDMENVDLRTIQKRSKKMKGKGAIKCTRAEPGKMRPNTLEGDKISEYDRSIYEMGKIGLVIKPVGEFAI